MEKTYACPQCGTLYSISDDLIGIPLECSNCQTTFIVPSNNNSHSIEEKDVLEQQKHNNFFRKHKKKILIATLLTFVLVFFLSILPQIIYRNLLKMPKLLLQYATFIGSPYKRAQICNFLAMKANLNKNLEERNFYYDKVIKILDKCEESPKILALKIVAKYRHDISGWISPEGKRLIELDKNYIISYVSAKYLLKQNTPAEHLLLKEYEQHLLNQINKKGMHPELTGRLGLFYYNNEFKDFPHDWQAAEFYLLENIKYKGTNYFELFLLRCYALQGKYAQMEELAEKKYLTTNDKGWWARTVFEIYSGHLSYQGTLVKLEKNYEKALKWKKLADKHVPHQKKFNDDLFNKAFPNKK